MLYDIGYRYFHALGAMYVTEEVTEEGNLKQKWNKKNNKAYIKVISDILEDVRYIRTNLVFYEDERSLETRQRLARLQNLIAYETALSFQNIKGPHNKTVKVMCKIYKDELYSDPCPYYLGEKP